MINPKDRFSDRVENYIKYRPHYPVEILDYLKKENVLDEKTVIADIGSGTGISAELFLKNGNKIYGVEPNKEMREGAEEYLAAYKNFVSIDGSAEHTTLKDSSVGLIAAGQAFHWFDKEECKKEFRRILKSTGFVELMWNKRKQDSDLMLEYDNLLVEFGTDYLEVRVTNLTHVNFEMFFERGYKTTLFDSEQFLDFEGFKGRLVSSSYAPNVGHKNYEPMIKKLEKIFNRYASNGKIKVEYTTQVYLGKV